MWKIFQWSLILFCMLLLSCGEQQNSSVTKETPVDPAPAVEKVVTDDQLEKSEKKVESERRRLKQNLVLKTDVDDRYSTTNSSSSFTGNRECGDYDDCRVICDRIKRNNSRCFSYSYNIVEDMEQALLTIRNIDEVNRVDIDPYIFEAILTLGTSVLSDLIEDTMSEGDLKSFLAWVALNEDIARVLSNKDRSGKILEKAFDELGRLQDGVTKHYEFIGLNTGLITDDDTFFYLASDEDNEKAFAMAYDILNSGSCRSITCQQQILCAREHRSRSRSSRRLFGNTRGISLCRTSSEARRSSRSSNTCYVHGSSVWSYLYDLIDDKEIRRAPSEFRVKPLGVKRCNDVCGRTSSKNQKCSLFNPEELR